MTQARCYQAAISYWRRIKTEPDARNMGVLYWQARPATPSHLRALLEHIMLQCVLWMQALPQIGCTDIRIIRAATACRPFLM